VTDVQRRPESLAVSLEGAADPSRAPERSAAAQSRFKSMFLAESSYVFCSLRRLGVPERDLEDLTHDVFMTVYRRLDDYDSSRPLRPWLFGIAFRTAWRYRDLARHRREVAGDAQHFADEAPAADEQLATQQARRLLMQALDSIDLDQRAVFVMHEIEGHSMPEVATALEIPLNTAYSRLRLARERMRAALTRLRLRQGES
jgi:RNA polymerase sigma-70 factor (ECF subfamily)